jgi:EAL and modified HD-GYP domain-containing signal transduction protein
MSAQDLFLGRQPILDRDQNLAAFELLFRSSHVNGAQIEDDLLASATVINHAFSELGVEHVLGRYLGFINLSAPLILSDVIELLPKDRVVLELLETVEVNATVVARLKELKAMGFKLALDDYMGQEAQYAEVLGVVDVVKVDVKDLDPARVKAITERLKRWPVRLLAEKVDTREQADLCRSLGYELFQGYYFARPSIIKGKRLSHAETAIMRLLGLVMADADTPEIEQVFRQNPDLSLTLLRLVNSVAVGSRTNITSLSQALVLLGRNQLQRWLQLLMYAISSSPDAKFPSPLLVLAATRGRMMEQLAAVWSGASTDARERAFLTGILSLVSALLGVPLPEVLKTLPLPDEVRIALLDRTGELGDMLRLVELVEQTDVDGIARMLEQLPFLDTAMVNNAYVDAIEWANRIGETSPG